MRNTKTYENIGKNPIPNESIKLSGKEYGNIPIFENHEKLVHISAVSLRGENAYFTADTPPYFHSAPGSIPHILVRESVAKKLSQVNKKLLEHGLEVFLFDGYRPLEVQTYFYKTWVPIFLKESYPDAPDDWIDGEVGKYWGKPFPL